MAENSKIEWCDHTFNPWVGCTKVSPACDHCYAEGWAKRTGQAHLWEGDRRRTSSASWRQPTLWNRKAKATGVRARVFCASLADVFDNKVPERWRDDLWHLIGRTSHLDWLLLTKRPQNIRKMLPGSAIGAPEWGAGWPNVWLGTTVENQEEADRRIPHLLDVPAKVHFLSCEPLLGPIDLSSTWHGESALDPECYGQCGWCQSGKPPLHNCQRGLGDWEKGFSGIGYVIAGYESGPKARPGHPDWVRSLRDQCIDADVPFHFKQWGEFRPIAPVRETHSEPWSLDSVREDRCVMVADDGSMWPDESVPPPNTWLMERVGKERAGAKLDGREWREMPE